MNDRPKQEQFKFSLSVRDKHNREVRKIVQFLRKKGILSQAVRDGLRLLNDLRRGNTRVLLEMFPNIGEKIHPSPSSNTGDLERQIADLKRIVLEQGMLAPPPKDYPQSKQLGKGISAHVITMPVILDDDDEDTIVLTKATGGKSNAENFMASMANIAY